MVTFNNSSTTLGLPPWIDFNSDTSLPSFLTHFIPGLVFFFPAHSMIPHLCLRPAVNDSKTTTRTSESAPRHRSGRRVAAEVGHRRQCRYAIVGPPHGLASSHVCDRVLLNLSLLISLLLSEGGSSFLILSSGLQLQMTGTMAVLSLYIGLSR